MKTKHWWYWEIWHNTQLQIIAVEAETQEEAVSIFTKHAGKSIVEKIDLHDFPLELSEGMGRLVQMLLSRYTLEEEKNGKISKLYKYTGQQLVLILGENVKQQPVNKFNLGKLLA